MKSKLRIPLFLCVYLVLLTISSKGQNNIDLNIYGYAQNLFENVDFRRSNNLFNDDNNRSYNSFLAQQLNLFFDGNLGNGFTSLVNLEFVNSVNTRNNTGQMAVREMWVNYRTNDKFNIRAGLLLPRFNRLNEINNRTPLFPYIYRPFVYETSYAEPVLVDDMLPQSGFFQVFGTIPMGGIDFEYSVFAGNNESSFVVKRDEIASEGLVNLSRDTLNAVALGGRIGLQYFDFSIGTFRIGVSGTLDKDNLSLDAIALNDESRQALPDIGAVDRYRLGFDASFDGEKLKFESEAVFVFNSLTNHQQSQVDQALASLAAGPYTGEFNKRFYYGALTYYVIPNLYISGMYSYYGDESLPGYDGTGLTNLQGTFGYHFSNKVVLKAEYGTFWMDNASSFEVLSPILQNPVSVDFVDKTRLKSFRTAISFLF